MAKCPKCERSLSAVDGERVSIKQGRSVWAGLMCACPYCHAALGVAVDPIAVKDDVVREVLKGLGK